VRAISNAAERMKNLIDDVLDVAPPRGEDDHACTARGGDVRAVIDRARRAGRRAEPRQGGA